ncbi:MAG: hypothetical protein IT209_12755 [Armatimonadetes bacterium]|nr:hypothetical protein [Armatimonadota bacterium]
MDGIISQERIHDRPLLLLPSGIPATDIPWALQEDLRMPRAHKTSPVTVSRESLHRLCRVAGAVLCLTLALGRLVSAQVFPDVSDAWTEFDTPAQAAQAGWTALPAGNPSLTVPKVDAWAGNAVQGNGWSGVAGGGIKLARSFGLPAYGAGSTLQFYLRAEANNPGSSGLSPVTLRARFPGGSVSRNLIMFASGPNPQSLYVLDMDISAASTSSDPWTAWKVDEGSGSLSNSSWTSLQSLEWSSASCKTLADFIQVDRLLFDMQSGTAKLTVRARNVPSQKYLIARVEPQGLGSGSVLCAVEVVNSASSVVLRRDVPMQPSQPKEIRLDYGSLPEGAYICRASAYRAGQLLAQGQAAFNHLADAPWLSAKVGVDPDRVVKPWTPMTSGSQQIGAWGRTMTWGTGVFPDSIVSAGEELLASPVRLVATVGAEEHVVRLKSFHITKQTPARIEAEAIGDICDVEVQTHISADFDGFVWFELKLKDPRRKVTISSLRMEAPLRSSQMKYFQMFRPSTEGAGAIGSSPMQIGWAVNDWVANFYQWFGNEDRGLGFTYSTLEKWKPASLANFCTFVPGSTTSVYRANLIESSTLADGLSFSLGLQATPIKPLPPDYHSMVADRAFAAPSSLAWLAMPGNMDMMVIWNTNVMQGLNDPEHMNSTNLTALRDSYQSRGVAAVGPASCPQKISPLMSPFSDYAYEWQRLPEDVLTWDGIAQYADCAQSTSYIDFLTYTWRSVMQTYSLDGFYFDGWLGAQFHCRNTNHGCGWTDGNGVVQPTVPVLASREAMKRFAIMMEDTVSSPYTPPLDAPERPGFPKYHYWVHTWEFVPPIIGFATEWLTGEQPYDCLLWNPDGSYAQCWGLDMFRSRCLSTNFGVPTYMYNGLLTEGTDPPSADKQTWMSFAWALPHGVPQGWLSSMNQTLVKQIYSVLRGFGVRRSDFIPCWRNNPNFEWVSTPGREDVYATWERNGRILLVISNLRSFNGGASSTVRLRWKGFANPSVRNMMTNTNISLNNNVLEITVPPERFALIRFQP